MGRPSHINMTIAIVLLAFIFLSYFSIYFLFVPFLAILPDLDHHKGYAKNKLGVRLPWKHRGFSHTIWFILLFMLIINLISFYLIKDLSFNNIDINTLKDFGNFIINEARAENIMLFIILNGHVLGDMITVNKVKYFSPLIDTPIGINLLSTGDKSKVTREMYVTFLISILNIFLLIYIISQYQYYYPLVENFFDRISNYDISIIIGIFIIQLIFSIYLFWIDLKKTLKHSKEIVSKIFKFLIMLIMLLIIMFIIYVGISYIEILTIYPQYLNYIYIGMLLITGYILFRITRKYLVSMSYTIAYMINSIYILLLSIILLYGTFLY